MELHRLWKLIWHRRLLVLAMVVAALAAGYAVTPRTSQYEAQASVFVGVANNTPYGVFSADLQLGQQELANSFATMVPTVSVAQQAIASTGIPRSPGQVAGEIKATVIAGTSLIAITGTDVDPVIAQRMTNGVAQAFVNLAQQIDPVTTTFTGGATAPRSPASITQEAILPVVPVSNGLTRTLILSGLFGLLAAVAFILLLDYLDLSVRSAEEVERRVGLPVLGVVPLMSRLPTREAITPAELAPRSKSASKA
ncbi:MAG TPA: Wzz/FepE/Etk N-terminal domain-containing protein [Acidimicrobiales bacterium]|nr:Wzz/FepE/Etk N-terminal domain-containing protein [Acidimicrobiales bacterium]